MTAAGTLSFSQGTEVVRHRTKSLMDTEIKGKMLILQCDSQKAESVIGIGELKNVFVANENSKNQSVISGKNEELKKLKLMRLL